MNKLKDILLSANYPNDYAISAHYKHGVKVATLSASDGVVTDINIPSNDYFAFEVFPTNKIIPVGTYDCSLYELETLPEANKEAFEKYSNGIVKVEDEKYRIVFENSVYQFVITDDVSISELFPGLVNTHSTGLQYEVKVPASMNCSFQVRTDQAKEDSNIIIDWGDGTIQNLKDLVLDPETENGLYFIKHKVDEDAATFVFESEHWRFNLTHTYKKVGYYVVKVYGNAFYIGGRINRGDGKDYSTISNGENIISRVFAPDLPLGTMLNQPTGLCEGSFKLLKVNIPRSMNFNHLYRIASTFAYCKNLQEVLVDHFANCSMSNVVWFGSVFDGCTNLKTLKMFIPPSSQEIATAFRNCGKLSCDIIYVLGKAAELSYPEIHPTGFIYNYTNFCGSFGKTAETDVAPHWSCSNYDLLAELLWDSGKKFDPVAHGFGDKVKPFLSCTSLSLELIPTSWGGTKPSTSV